MNTSFTYYRLNIQHKDQHDMNIFFSIKISKQSKKGCVSVAAKMTHTSRATSMVKVWLNLGNCKYWKKKRNSVGQLLFPKWVPMQL